MKILAYLNCFLIILLVIMFKETLTSIEYLMIKSILIINVWILKICFQINYAYKIDFYESFLIMLTDNYYIYETNLRI